MDASNPYAPPQATVRDVAAPTAELEPAERLTRLGASLLDGLIMAGMVYLPLVLGGALVASQNQMSGLFAIPVVIGLVGCVAWVWLTVLYVSRNGQSIAKKMLGIKVVRSDGSRAGLGRIFWLRNVANGVLSAAWTGVMSNIGLGEILVALIVPLYAIADILLIFSEQRQCLHDKIADTIVVKA